MHLHLPRFAPGPGGHPGKPKGGPNDDCTTTTVTLTQYAATVTSIRAHDNATAPLATHTISLIPASGLITHPKNSTSSSLPITSPILLASQTTPAPTTRTPPKHTPPPSPQTDPAHTAGRVAGGVVGGLAGLALLVILLAWCCRRKSQIKVKLRCRRQTKEEKQEAKEAREREELERRRRSALVALGVGGHGGGGEEAQGVGKVSGGLVHSGLLGGAGGNAVGQGGTGVQGPRRYYS